MHFGIGGERGATAAECSSQQYTAAAAASNCEGSKWVDGAKERERERERERRGFENSPSPDDRPSLRHTQVSLNGNAVERVTSRHPSIPSFELLMQTYGN